MALKPLKVDYKRPKNGSEGSKMSHLSILGQLVVGIGVRNIEFFENFIRIDQQWEVFLRQAAFILILIRCGVGLNADVLRRSLVKLKFNQSFSIFQYFLSFFSLP